MATNNYPAALPLKDQNGKPVFPVTHNDYVIGSVKKKNPQFEGSIFLNGIAVFATTTEPGSGNVVVNPLEPGKGGTGFDNLNDLAKKIAEILGFTGEEGEQSIGIIPITKGGTGETSAAAALKALGAASCVLLNVSIPLSWSDDTGSGYTQTINVAGIKATDVPVVGVILSSDKSAALLQGKAFGCVNRITTADGSITLYCYNTKPTTAVTIQLLVVRGFN